MLRIGRYHFTVTDSILMGDPCRPSRVSGSAAFFQTPLDWLMLAVPAAFAIVLCPLGATSRCSSSPPASALFLWLGRATELLSARTGFLKTRLTNGAIEAVNGLLQLTKRLARGFRSLRYFRIMAYLKAAGLRLNLPKLKPSPVTHSK